jgi:phage-related protein
MRGLFRTSFVAVLLAGVGSDVVSTEASASIRGLWVSDVAVAPRVVSAVAGDGFAQVTIADMSPDTGVYAVQFVSSGQSFDWYQMYRTTSKTMTVPNLACTRSYTLRVFVMAANWLLTDGHQTQNVTPHSQTFDLTMPACVNAAPGVSALTCAAGGTCIVGDTGPGGGVVFYVQASGGTFTSTGSDCGTACKYLEAAPSDQSTGIVWATTAAFCYNSGSTTETNSCQSNSIYSGDSTAQADSRTAATAIGKGMANTNQIYARVSNNGGAGGAATNTYAAGIAYAYANSGKTDWHLPSKDELNQMCKWQRGVAWVSDATVCTGGTLNSGTGASGFSAAGYWSSSETAALNAWSQGFSIGSQINNFKTNSLPYVRPVRAFG